MTLLANFAFDLKLNMTAGEKIEKILHERVIHSSRNPSATAVFASSRKRTRYFRGLLLCQEQIELSGFVAHELSAIAVHQKRDI